MESIGAESGEGFLPRPGTYESLPSGRHALPEDVVAAHQRARLERATLELAGQAGYAQIAVRDILERAGTSRRVFYAHYPDKASCFLAGYESAIDELEARVAGAAGPQRGFGARLTAALTAVVSFLDEEPSIGRALVIEVHAAGTDALQARARAMKRAAQALGRLGAQEAGPGRAPSEIAAEGVLGGVEHSLRMRLREDEPEPASGLVRDLARFAMLNYLGEVIPADAGSPAPG